METIYSEIIARLKSEVPELRYIAPDDGQFEVEPDDNNNYPVLLPCALIEVEAIDWTSTDYPVQRGDAVLTIRFGWRQPSRLDNLQSATATADALARWAVHKKIAKALNGFSGTNFGELERSRTEREKLPGAVKLFNISFDFAGEEDLTP